MRNRHVQKKCSNSVRVSFCKALLMANNSVLSSGCGNRCVSLYLYIGLRSSDRANDVCNRKLLTKNSRKVLKIKIIIVSLQPTKMYCGV